MSHFRREFEIIIDPNITPQILKDRSVIPNVEPNTVQTVPIETAEVPKQSPHIKFPKQKSQKSN